ncbi:TIGR02444 family protein [Ferrovibrio sp.]|uniref:TIGR02444 family protein n=1 Tax=Ferrovibrio sp. TaxID=1917215 RepID=UPI003D12BFA1
MTAPGTAFWRFSLALYGRPGVADSCLKLQDEAGADVNLLLLGFWRAEQGLAPWGEAEIATLAAAIAPVNEVLRPFRVARRRLKGLAGTAPVAPDLYQADLYQQAKALELRLEELVQIRLAELTPAPAAGDLPKPDAAAAHLAAYMATLAQPAHPAAEALLAASGF